MKHLVIINGKSGSGKDTFVQQVDHYFGANDPYREDSKRWMVYNLSSVQPIKDIITALGLDDPDKGIEWRELVVDIKAALNKNRRAADKMAVKAAKEAFDSNNETYNGIVFLHVRESFSIETIEKLAPFSWKVSTLWVERPDVPTVANDESYDTFTYDFIITNGGTLDELKAQAIEFAKKFED